MKPAKRAPTIGPTQYTQKLEKSREATADPSHLAGLAAPPVSGPAISMSAANVIPINNPEAPGGTLSV